MKFLGERYNLCLRVKLPLRGGIVGCGYFGQIQLEAWGRIPEAEIVAACDTDPDRAKRLAAAAYTSAEEMIETESLDFLDIATRPSSHRALVRLGAAHKVATICQKPMALNWKDALAMVEATESAGIPFMIHENWRWQPWHREVKRLMETGAIGKVLSYSFQMRQRDGLGDRPYPRQPYFAEMPRLLIYETLVHQIDTSRFLFGEIESVLASARRVNPLIAGEDQAVLVLTHDGGLQGVIDGNRFADPVPPGPAAGVARLDGEKASLIVPANGDIFLDDRKVWSNTEEKGYKGDSVRATQAHFIRCLRTGEPFETSGREYLKTFAVVETAYESIARGEMARVNKWE